MSQITRLFDFPYYQLEKYNLEKALVTKHGEEWVATSTQEYIDQANTFSRGLLRLGIKKDDKIAVISHNNRTEWNIADIGILQTGAQNVPVYPTISEDDIEYILNHSNSQYVIVSNQELFDKVSAIRGKVAGLKDIYSFEEVPGCKNWKEILELGKDTSNQSEVDSIKQTIGTDDLATIIYTSGTTGRPKGVMLSHKNIVSNVLMSEERVPFEKGQSVALSFLPVCHIYERMILYIYQYVGVSIYFAESIEKVSANIKEVKPHVITAVPRLLEKVYDAIIAKGSDLTGIKRKLFFWAVDVGQAYEPYGANGVWYGFKLWIARKLIFSKWKAGLGGNLGLMVSGSAAIQPRLARVFAAAEIPVMEGYGLTETSPVIAVNDQRNHGFKVGTVGRPLKGVEVKIAQDGEILTKSDSVMMGYYNDPEKTAEVITDGYFHTGDIGEVDKDGFLKITDRKKEMFKTSGGKYIAPQLLENAMKQSRFIEQVMVIGDGEKMPAAFIQPDFAFVKQWAQRKGLSVDSNEQIAQSKEVHDRIQEEVDAVNKKFGHWEQVKKFEITPDVWSVEGGEMTPTLKLKRKAVKEKYQKLYDKIYRE
ncbi:AMP-dependent synthetase [Flavobacterium akiainvivens]|uniref:AMP-dependent synthetase n=1 Tax=Flavobacterium akiainvivens TaxID=1202724 RepID=A0A0M8MCX3_9FLAO|nr:AMP-dependent synthetase/ligase [Flavobacterium akiainvivens]KOS06174.1 AMP-dependent synthetase [Flavobacterium akiainvivens]SFQ68255.1 long-chain acyl-CoA synthetase [Flavobacterium akiainvivens]